MTGSHAMPGSECGGLPRRHRGAGQAGRAGRYVLSLGRALAAADDVGITIICRQGDRAWWEEQIGSKSVIDVGPTRRPVRLAWEQAALPRLLARLPVDVHHGPHYTMPLLSNRPTVVTVHDLSFFSHPELAPAGQGGVLPGCDPGGRCPCRRHRRREPDDGRAPPGPPRGPRRPCTSSPTASTTTASVLLLGDEEVVADEAARARLGIQLEAAVTSPWSAPWNPARTFPRWSGPSTGWRRLIPTSPWSWPGTWDGAGTPSSRPWRGPGRGQDRADRLRHRRRERGAAAGCGGRGLPVAGGGLRAAGGRDPRLWIAVGDDVGLGHGGGGAGSALLVTPGTSTSWPGRSTPRCRAGPRSERRRRQGLEVAAGHTWEESAAAHAELYRSVR